MNNMEYNNSKDNLIQLQGEIDKIVSSYESLVNANKVDLEHVNILNEKLNSILIKARDELKNIDFLRLSKSEEDNVMYDNLKTEKTKITNHPIRHIISQEKNRLDKIIGIKEEDGKYFLTDEKREEIKDKLVEKYKYESEIKKQKEEIKELQEKLVKETDEHIIKNIKSEIEAKSEFIKEYVTEMKKIRKELIDERRKAKSLFDEDVVAIKQGNHTIYTRTSINPFIEEESIDGKTINPLRNISDIEEEDRKIIEERRAKYEKFKPIIPPQPEKSLEFQEEKEQQPEQKEMTKEEIEQAINAEIDEQEEKNEKKEESNVPVNKGKKSSIALKSIGKFALKIPGAILIFAVDMVGEIVEFAKAVYEKVK